MRTVLVNLPWNENGRFGVRSGSRWPFTSLPEKDGKIHYFPFPFFLAYATALLKRDFQDAKLIDAVAEEIGAVQLIDKIRTYDPYLIVIETSTPSFYNDIMISKDIYDRFPNCQIALCGPHASVFPEQILSEYNFINYILLGEYEYTLLDLVNHLEDNLSLDSILGLAYRKSVNIQINNPRPTIDNVDDLPWPEREALPIYKYNDGFCNLPQPNVQIWSSRGCPFQCIFCLWPQIIYREHKYRKRDPAKVVDELEFLIKKFHFKAAYFDDDVFNVDKKHVLDICKGIKKRKINIPWAAMARVDLMDEELLERMVDAGLYAIKYGVESASQKVLNFCKKNINLEKALRIIRFTKSLGVKVHLTFCLGLPGETRETINETVRFIKDIHPDSMQFSFATPFPGTEYYKHLEEESHLLSKDWSDYDGNYRCIVKTEELSNRDLEMIKYDFSSNLNL